MINNMYNRFLFEAVAVEQKKTSWREMDRKLAFIFQGEGGGDYLLPGGEIYLAHDRERLRVLAPFLKMAENQFEVATSIRRLRSGEDQYEIVLNRLRPKPL